MKMVITVEVRDQEEARMIAKGLQDETIRSLAAIFGKLNEMEIDPRDHRRVLEMAYEIKFGKGRH